MNPQPKNPPGRSEAYLDYIRSLPCIVCRNPAEPHHTESGGVGLKGSDFSCVPLCRKHHRELHDMTVSEFESKYYIELKTYISDYLLRYADMFWSDTS